MKKAEQILYDSTGMLAENHPSVVEAMKQYAKEACKEALKNASERARLIAKEYDCDCGNTHLDWNIDKQSILSESNIPVL